MKLRIAHGPFAAAVADAARALPARPPVPVLAALKLTAENGMLTAAGFDYEVSGQASAPADVTEPGTVLVSGRLLAEITRILKGNQPIDLQLEGARLTLVSGPTRYTLHTLPLEEYPSLPKLGEPSGTLSGSELADAVAQVFTAAGRDDTLPVLTGIQLDLGDGKLTLAATDRYRFAVRTLNWDAADGAPAAAKVLIPAKGLMDTVKMLTDADRISVTLPGLSGVLGLSAPSRATTMRAIEGELPKYREIWPKHDSFNATAVIDTSELVAAVKRVALVAGRNQPIQLAFTDGSLSLQAGTSDDAQAVDVLDAQFQADEDFTIAFNPAFLLDGLIALAAPATAFWFTEKTKPALLTGADAGADISQLDIDDDALQYLLMPIRLSD
ncbi:DNA polymerase III subunit beta [Streptomyces mirabilis]|uniref:DNA polymerase III subunit beta n=1 Tax=Streptomyces mirabilis TaxID=68239 RepID=UPI0036C12138